jgi:soluble lytic murein transglycosylase-like protein
VRSFPGVTKSTYLLFLLFPLTICGAGASRAAALPAATGQTARPADYEAQRVSTDAASVASLASVRAAGEPWVGHTVEIRGQVKGTFVRNGQLAMWFEVADGELITLTVPPVLRSAGALRGGTYARLLLQVSQTTAGTLSFNLVNISDKAPAPRLFRADDDAGAPVILTPMTGTGVPQRQVVANLSGPAYGNSAPPAGVTSAAPAGAAAAPASPAVADTTDQLSFYESLVRRYNPRLPEKMVATISSAVLDAAASQNLDPRFLAAVVAVESGFDPYCLSSSGAMGLGQIMPFNLRGLGITNAWDPTQNLRGAARILRNNLNRFAGQPNGTLLAVAAYNAGGNSVERAGNQVPNKAETQRYVWKIYYTYKALAPELFH